MHIDPRTGWPARGVAGLSVIAATGVASDALTTALFVLGSERGCAPARAAGVEALWVLDDMEMVVTSGLLGRLELRDAKASPRSCGSRAGPAKTPLPIDGRGVPESRVRPMRDPRRPPRWTRWSSGEIPSPS